MGGRILSVGVSNTLLTPLRGESCSCGDRTGKATASNQGTWNFDRFGRGTVLLSVVTMDSHECSNARFMLFMLYIALSTIDTEGETLGRLN